VVKKNISIIIPVYNSEKNLNELNKRIISVLSDSGNLYEIIYINDGSIDNSEKVLYNLTQNNSKIKVISLSKNYGQHNALLCGIREAKFDTIITLDDDLQNPPEEIPQLIEKLDEGFDVVYGYPMEEQHSFLRNFASIFTKLALQTAMGIDNAKHVSSFRAFKTDLREAFHQYKGSFVSIDVLLSWGSNAFSAIPVDHNERRLGKSNYTFRKLVQHALNMITGFSVLPLQIASIMGIVLAIFGLFVLIYVVGRFLLQGSPMPGFPFIASIISIFSGAQLLAIGIIGEYLARMHFRMLDKPQYFVKEKSQNK
jgi:undecaprenyl-phosphate 4-deoxy-4-formamido-L-arabinose transferase